ncbi:GntR family transcriptional regulator [Streptomyces sp. NPDC056652]|uniref:GntR family transcriptional regulator n=1 Tax=Streptomyces sp. NPDC056652 TaxID=3345893 RepID=UPI00369B26A5
MHGSGVPWGSTVAPRPWQGRAEADGAHRSGRECGRGRRGRSRRVRSRVHRSRYPPAWLADYRQPPDDPRPPYVRTADALRKQIQDGRLAPGAKLPSARNLQAQYGIANSTAQNALRVLKPAVGDRRPLLSAALLATAADHSARRARERKPDHQSEAPVRSLSSRLAGLLRGVRRARAVPDAHACCLAGVVTMEITGLMPVRG